MQIRKIIGSTAKKYNVGEYLRFILKFTRTFKSISAKKEQCKSWSEGEVKSKIWISLLVLQLSQYF